jgi:large subunit ribosomal protein L25
MRGRSPIGGIDPVEITLAAEARQDAGKGAARKLRAAGKVPAVVYGIGGDAISIAVDLRALTAAMHTEAGRNVLIDLKIGSDNYLTLAREIQRDPLRGTITHADFFRVNRNQAVHVDVSIHIEGESPGVKEGGVVEHHLWNVSVECLPTNVPDRIIADISAVQLGEALHVSQLGVPDGVTILTDGDEIVLSVVVPQVLKVEEEVVAAEGEEAAAETAEAAGEAPATEE